MKKLLMKFSDERSRKNSIRTLIIKDGDKKYVRKEPVFPEGQEHMQDMLRYRDLLERVYAPCRVCPVSYIDGGLNFEFIKAESFEDAYKKAYLAGDKGQFTELLVRHKKILETIRENQISFHETEEFRRDFGDGSVYEGQPGFAVSNFDAIAGNILFTGEGYTFIDYEWVIEYPMPRDLVYYHSISDLYVHHPGLDGFYPIERALEAFGVAADPAKMQKNYQHYWFGLIREDGRPGFAESKFVSRKKVLEYRDLLSGYENKAGREKAEEEALRWKGLYEGAVKDAQFAESQWKQSVQYVQSVQKTLDDNKGQISNLLNQIEGGKVQHANEQAALMKEYQTLNADRDIWKKRYEEVTASKAYRMALKARKVLHR